MRSDFSLSTDVAAKHSQKLAELKVLFMKAAEKNDVLPLDDRLLVRGNADAVGRPYLMSGRRSLTLAEGG